MELPAYFQELQAIFKECTPTERMEELIRIGKELPEYPEELKTEDRKIPGCVSTVYVTIDWKEDKCALSIHADALIVKGLLFLLHKLLHQKTAKEIIALEEPLQTFIKEAQLNISTVPTRQNTVMNVYARIKKSAEEQV